jgi:hypothetical protein
LQPFVLFSKANSLTHLRNLGFKTFGNYWDESYDTIEDDNKRIISALNSIKQFISKDKEQIHKTVQHMFPILIHNYYQLKARNENYSQVIINLYDSLIENCTTTKEIISK